MKKTSTGPPTIGTWCAPEEDTRASKVNRESADGRPLGIVEVEGALFEALLDTGAGISVISEEVWEKMNRPRLQKSIIRVQGAFGDDGDQCM